MNRFRIELELDRQFEFTGHMMGCLKACSTYQQVDIRSKKLAGILQNGKFIIYDGTCPIFRGEFVDGRVCNQVFVGDRYHDSEYYSAEKKDVLGHEQDLRHANKGKLKKQRVGFAPGDLSNWVKQGASGNRDGVTVTATRMPLDENRTKKMSKRVFSDSEFVYNRFSEFKPRRKEQRLTPVE